jgi:hypothetical protein
MSAQSAACRVRSRFMRLGFWTSCVAFVVIEGDALLDQSEIGHASILFMFGAACLAAAACIGFRDLPGNWIGGLGGIQT